MWVTLLQQCRLGLCQDSDFVQEILKIRNPLLEEHCACSEVIHLFQSVGCVRNKLQFRTVQQNQKPFLLNAGLRLGGIPALDLWDLIVAVLGNTNQNRIEQGDLSKKNKREACSPPHTIHKRKQSQRVGSMIWIMLILFPQTSNLLIRKLCCMCLKTTKQ